MADRLSRLLGAISDGTAVDWDAAEREVESGRPLRRVRTLRALATIASAHRTVQPAHASRLASVDSSRPPLATLGTWGPYVLVGHLGRGTSADVFRAYDPRLDREVALKLLTPFHSGRHQGDVVIAEGRNLAKVRHPNIAAVFAAERIDGRVGIVMELVEGRSLEQEIQSGIVVQCDRIAQVGLQLCCALAAVHKAGLVHRDVKAQNVIVERDGRLVLTDFGTAVASSSGQAAVMAGTPMYAPPEMFLSGEVSPRSDIYSLGVLLFRMLTGMFPVEGDTISAMRQAHVELRRRRLADLRPDLPTALIAAIDVALSPDPADRHVSIDAMRNAIELSFGHVDSRRRSPWRGARSWWTAAAVVVAVAAGTLFNAARDSPPTSPVVDSITAPSQGVLVANFENATGDRDLDEVITDVVERDLGRSRQIHLVGRERVEDVLRLMQQPVNAVLDDQLAHQVSVRDGGVRLIIAGRIDRLGGIYTISARAIEPESGRTLAAVSEDASSQDDLVPALQRLTDRVRLLLGELPGRPDGGEPLERVTTPSLRALRLYSESYRLGFRTEWKGALDLARQAVAVDPQFASAQIWLAWALYRTGADAAEYLPVARHAVDLSQPVDDIERFWISASYYTLAGDDANAEGAYQALLQLKPDHYWALNNIKSLYQRQNRWQDAIRYQRRMADMRPSDIPSNFTAAESLARVGDFDAARTYVERLRRLAPLTPAYREAWVRYFEASVLLSQRDISSATTVVMRILAALPPPSEGELRDWLVQRAVRYFVTTGQMKRALATMEMFHDRNVFYPFNRAYTAFAAEDFNTARAAIAESNVRPYVGSAAWLMVRLGMPEAAERLILRTLPGNRVDYFVGASLVLRRDEIDAAIPMLEAQLSDAAIMHAAIAHDLAEAWTRKGRPDRAIDVLRTAVQFDRGNDAMVFGPFGPEWMPNALTLAKLCRANGCPHQANAVESDLERLLVAADDDFPLRVELRRLQAQGATRPSPK